MVCLYCGGKTEIYNSRSQRASNSTWRRRRCLACGATFSSIESLAYGSSLALQNGTSHIVPFKRDVLFLSLYEACRHRKHPIADATALAGTVVGKLLKKQTKGLLTREEIIKTASTALKQFDHAAYVQ